MVPDHFQFTFKLSKTVSHSKGLDFNADDISLFIQTINNVEHKKGCILVQFPPSLKPAQMKQAKKLFKTINTVNAKQPWKVAVEFRNNDWYNDETFKLLKQHNFSLVIHDIPASATPLIAPVTDMVYLRFHGTEKGYRGSYDDALLLEYAQYIKQWTGEGKYVYCYFNNTLGNAFKNLQTLNGTVTQVQGKMLRSSQLQKARNGYNNK